MGINQNCSCIYRLIVCDRVDIKIETKFELLRKEERSDCYCTEYFSISNHLFPFNRAHIFFAEGKI